MNDTSALQQELIQLEIRFWEALQRRDAQTLAELTADSSVVVNSAGTMVVDPQSLATMAESADWEILAFEIDPASVKVLRLADDIALVAYGVDEDMRVGDEAVRLNAFDTTVWQRHSGRWKSVLHTESIAGDAFGRDRLGEAVAGGSAVVS